PGCPCWLPGPTWLPGSTQSPLAQTKPARQADSAQAQPSWPGLQSLSLVCSSETSIGLENPAEPSQASPHPRYLGRGRRAASRDRPCDPRAQPEDERSRRETAGRSPEGPWETPLREPPATLHRTPVGWARRADTRSGG